MELENPESLSATEELLVLDNSTCDTGDIKKGRYVWIWSKESNWQVGVLISPLNDQALVLSEDYQVSLEKINDNTKLGSIKPPLYLDTDKQPVEQDPLFEIAAIAYGVYYADDPNADFEKLTLEDKVNWVNSCRAVTIAAHTDLLSSLDALAFQINQTIPLLKEKEEFQAALELQMTLNYAIANISKEVVT
jgi:hypothetical protein